MSAHHREASSEPDKGPRLQVSASVEECLEECMWNYFRPRTLNCFRGRQIDEFRSVEVSVHDVRSIVHLKSVYQLGLSVSIESTVHSRETSPPPRSLQTSQNRLGAVSQQSGRVGKHLHAFSKAQIALDIIPTVLGRV